MFENHVFIDGQNLYLSARQAFDLRYPDFDIVKIGEKVSDQMDPSAKPVIHFYIGMPVRKYSPKWTEFWSNKVENARNRGVFVTTRPLRYITETDPSTATGFKVLSSREKGIDLRLALDVMISVRQPNCRNIAIVSRDQDFSEVIGDAKHLCELSNRRIGLWSAYPVSPSMPWHNRGIEGTQEIEIDSAFYNQCLDPIDYRMEDGIANTVGMRIAN